MREGSFHFSSKDLEGSLSSLKSNGITEFTLQDDEILSHKGKLLSFLEKFSRECPDIFLILPVNASVLDMDVCKICSGLYCTLEIPLEGFSKENSYLFDKKFFSRRAQMLNTFGLVFGFDLDFACVPGDSVKLFRDRLDFAVSLYPNHIDFSQEKKPHNSATFSSQDISACKETAFSVQVFYSGGRAVTWFLAVLKPLKMSASKFFQDFAEWQNLNNCGLKSNWNVIEAGHAEIEKMQLKFLKFKYEEKGKSELFDAVSNIVRLNGAISRCYGEGEESEVELSYNPDELLSGAAMDVQKFFDNSFMEMSHVKVFRNEQGEVDYHYC